MAITCLTPASVAFAAYSKEEDSLLSYSDPSKNTLAENIDELSILLGRKVSDEYAEKEEEIKEMIKKNGWNYEYTVQSFYDQKSPYSDIDYASVIAAYATVLQYGRESGPLFTDLDLIEMSVEAAEVPDDEIDEKYGRVTFSVRNAEEFFNEYGLSLTNKNIKADYDYRYQKINAEISEETIQSSISILTPDGLTLVNQKTYEEYAAMLPDDLSPERRAIVLNALALLGKVPYEWGGKPTKSGYDSTWWSFDTSGQQKGLDCSGFVQWVYMTSGYPKAVTGKIYSTSSINKNLVSISKSELQPGDIGLMNNTSSSQNHTGIYLGNDLWIHCSSSAKTVIVSNFDFKYFKAAPLANTSTDGETVSYRMSSTNGATSEEEAIIKAWSTQTEEESANESTSEGSTQSSPSSESAVTVTEAKQNTETESSGTAASTKTEETTGATAPESAAAETTEPAQTTATEETTVVPATESTVQESESTYSDEDVELLAQLITHEAIGEGRDGWIAVGEVVCNRVESAKFPNTIREVIFQSGQFSGAKYITSIEPSAEILEIARGLLDGSLRIFNNKNVLYFCNPASVNGTAASVKESWNGKEWYTYINHHAFYLG